MGTLVGTVVDRCKDTVGGTVHTLGGNEGRRSVVVRVVVNSFCRSRTSDFPKEEMRTADEYRDGGDWTWTGLNCGREEQLSIGKCVRWYSRIGCVLVFHACCLSVCLTSCLSACLSASLIPDECGGVSFGYTNRTTMMMMENEE